MVDKIVDIKMRRTSEGYYDMDFQNGDIVTVGGFDTAVQMSLLCERRASGSEVERPEKRRGWFGNEDSEQQGFEIGSKLWLLDQSRATTQTLNRAINYTKDGLDWLVTNSYLDRVQVKGEIIGDKIILYISLYRNNNKIFYRAFDLWEKTFIDGEI